MVIQYLRNLLHKHQEINLPVDTVKAIIEKNNAERWFVYAFEERRRRWHIWKPSRWLAKNIATDKLIFETGCGCGLNLIWFAQQGFKNLYGSDISIQAINAGKEIVSFGKWDVHLWNDDALKPVKLPTHADAVLGLNWTYHSKQFNLYEFVALYSKILDNGGFIILDVIDSAYNAVPNNQYLTSDWHKLRYERKPSEYHKRYSVEDVVNVMKKCGLDIVKTFSKKQLIPRVVYIAKKIR